MDRVQQIVPISDMKLKHATVLNLLHSGPVVLAQRSKPAAVLISVGQWNKLIDELDQLRDLVDVLDAEVENAGAEPEPFQFGELEPDAIPA